MKKFVQRFLVVLGLAGFVLLPAAPALATNVFPVCKTSPDTSVCEAQSNDSIFGTGGLFSRVINILLVVIGTISVILIIVGGIRYVTSGGDQAQISSAKNTILYAIVGVVVAVMSYAIVNFVVGKLV